MSGEPYICPCGHDPGDQHFDRSLCACGAMHTYCNGCGDPIDDCPYKADPAPVPDRQKLAETVREAHEECCDALRYTWLGQSEIDAFDAALDALAQPCQECEALRERLAAAERKLVAALKANRWLHGECQAESDRAETAERQLADAREALERIRDWRGFRHTGEVRDCADAALAATEPVPQQTEEGTA